MKFLWQALLQFWALIEGLCVVLLGQAVECACRALDSTVTHPRAMPDAANWARSRATALPEF